MFTMICGLPNAGKTTFSKRFANALHQDDIGTLNRVIDAIKQTNGDVVAEGYFGRSEERERVLATQSGWKRCIFIDVTTDESIQREDRNRHPQILRNASMFFEPPTYSEGWDEIIIIRSDSYA